jgi:hypothetical protein
MLPEHIHSSALLHVWPVKPDSACSTRARNQGAGCWSVTTKHHLDPVHVSREACSTCCLLLVAAVLGLNDKVLAQQLLGKTLTTSLPWPSTFLSSMGSMFSSS